MKQLFEELSKRLAVLDVAYVDRYNGDPEAVNRYHASKYPACFIELGTFAAERDFKPGQLVSGTMDVTIHLVQQHQGDAYTVASGGLFTTPEVKQDSLPTLDYLQSVALGLTYLGELISADGQRTHRYPAGIGVFLTSVIPATSRTDKIVDRIVCSTGLQLRNC